MFDLMFIFAVLTGLGAMISESLEKPVPQGIRFDWDAYYKDIENGITITEQIKKREKGGYDTFEPPCQHTKSVKATEYSFDYESYEYDRKTYGECLADTWKKQGFYRRKK